jgi:hypothetical protein
MRRGRDAGSAGAKLNAIFTMQPTRAAAMSRSPLILPLQLFAAGAALFVIAVAPPAEGELLLVPLAGQSADSVAAWATRAGARIVGRGPLPGSLAVEARTAALADAALRHATLITAAPPAACGAGR